MVGGTVLGATQARRYTPAVRNRGASAAKAAGREAVGDRSVDEERDNTGDIIEKRYVNPPGDAPLATTTFSRARAPYWGSSPCRSR